MKHSDFIYKEFIYEGVRRKKSNLSRNKIFYKEYNSHNMACSGKIGLFKLQRSSLRGHCTVFGAA
jgi:hypothetical protein